VDRYEAGGGMNDAELYPAQDYDLGLRVRTKPGQDPALVAEEATEIIIRSLRDCGEHELADALT